MALPRWFSTKSFLDKVQSLIPPIPSPPEPSPGWPRDVVTTALSFTGANIGDPPAPSKQDAYLLKVAHNVRLADCTIAPLFVDGVAQLTGDVTARLFLVQGADTTAISQAATIIGDGPTVLPLTQTLIQASADNPAYVFLRLSGGNGSSCDITVSLSYGHEA